MYTLTQLRESLNLSISEFARSVNIAQPRISEYENDTHKISMKSVLKIMEAHNVVAQVKLETQDWVFIPNDEYQKSKPSIEEMMEDADNMYPDD